MRLAELPRIIKRNRRLVGKGAWLAVGASLYALSVVWTPHEGGIRQDVLVVKNDAQGHRPLNFYMATLVFVTSGSSWVVPGDCSLADYVDCIGAGADGTISAFGGDGGGGGAFARGTSIALTPGGSVSIQVGAALDTCFGGTSLGACTVGAQKATGTTAGTASASVGSLKYNGGAGVAGGGFVPGSGGGAGGLNGAGVAAVTDGGAGDAGFGGAGGSGSGAGTAGGNGTEYDASHGSGGGGGRSSTANGNAGGAYGGGGGGANSGTVGAGSQGLIVVSYTPSSSSAARSFGFIIG